MYMCVFTLILNRSDAFLSTVLHKRTIYVISCTFVETSTPTGSPLKNLFSCLENMAKLQNKRAQSFV